MSAIDKATELVEAELAERKAELEEKVGPLVAKVKELEAWLKKHKKGSTAGSTSSVSDEDLVTAVAHVSKNGPAKTVDISKFMGVDSRQIAKKLSTLAGKGIISGNKDEGYSA